MKEDVKTKMKNRFSSEDKNQFIIQSPKLFLSQILGIDLQPFHKEWIDIVENNRFTVLLAPRGSGKTTVMTVGYGMWRVLLNRKLRILIVSNTQTQAETIMRQIRSYVDTNPKIEDIFGEIKANVWTSGELDFKGHGAQKETTVTALGAHGSLIGRHMDIIFLDDIIDGKNTNTKMQRDKMWEWYFNTLMPMLEPDGEIHIIGTRWHEADLYSQIVSTGGYKSKIYKALDGRTSYWPEKYPYELLRDYRRQNPEAFAMSYQNEIVQGESAIFHEKDFKYYEKLPPGLFFYQGVDLAASKTGDYFVICTVAKDEVMGNYYVVDVYRARLSLSKQYDAIIHEAERFNPVKIGVESGAYQTALTDELKSSTVLPIKSISQKVDKVTRARSMSVLFENGQVYFPSRKMRLIEELRRFPKVEYDDTVDALDIAIRVSQKRRRWNWGEVSQRIQTGQYMRKI